MDDVPKYLIWLENWVGEEPTIARCLHPQGEWVKYEDHKKIVDGKDAMIKMLEHAIDEHEDEVRYWKGRVSL